MKMRVRIDEKGNSQLEKLEKTVVRTFNPRDEHSPVYRKSLRKVFNCLANNKDHKKPVKNENLPDGIFPETLEYARSFIIAKLPGLYADNIGGWPKTHYRFLVDENLPPVTVRDLWKEFGRATHTNFEKLATENDKKVWNWAESNAMSAIVTRDKRMSDQTDLGMIAVRRAYDLLRKRKSVKNPVYMPRQPLLIQIDSTSKKSVLSMMSLYKKEIMEHLENRSVPYIFLTDKRCITGPSYDDIAKYDWNTIKQMASDILNKARRQTTQTYPSASPS